MKIKVTINLPNDEEQDIDMNTDILSLSSDLVSVMSVWSDWTSLVVVIVKEKGDKI